MTVTINSMMKTKNYCNYAGLKNCKVYIVESSPDGSYNGFLIQTMLFPVVDSLGNKIFGLWIGKSGYFGEVTYDYRKFMFAEVDIEINITGYAKD